MPKNQALSLLLKKTSQLPLHNTNPRFTIAAGFIGAGLFSGWLFFF
jgi:hypothetical protein